jgi:hypothetical protein
LHVRDDLICYLSEQSGGLGSVGLQGWGMTAGVTKLIAVIWLPVSLVCRQRLSEFLPPNPTAECHWVPKKENLGSKMWRDQPWAPWSLWCHPKGTWPLVSAS